jgi:hypothetical protein
MLNLNYGAEVLNVDVGMYVRCMGIYACPSDAVLVHQFW